MDSQPSVNTNNPSIKMVALDFDLTIYNYAAPADTLHLREWFERLDHSGISTSIISGRRLDDLEKTLQEINFPWAKPFPSIVVCLEGNISHTDGTEPIMAQPWNLSRRRKVQAANQRLMPIFQTAIKQAQANGCKCIEPLTPGLEGVKVVFETPAMAEKVRQSLEQSIATMPDLTVSRNHHIVLGLPTGADKGGALAELARISGYHHEQVLAIGDNLNDLSMLDGKYGFQVATVGNADGRIRETVREKGGFVASAACAFGVIEIFEYYFGKLTPSANHIPTSAAVLTKSPPRPVNKVEKAVTR